MSGAAPPLLVVLTGPTGSGKSELALQLAERLAPTRSVEIISADSAQVYRGRVHLAGAAELVFPGGGIGRAEFRGIIADKLRRERQGAAAAPWRACACSSGGAAASLTGSGSWHNRSTTDCSSAGRAGAAASAAAP